jgi:transcriptional regulator with XRE-family HTH domain
LFFGVSFQKNHKTVHMKTGIGKVLCLLREAKWVSQDEMASSVGINQGYMSRLEAGKRMPSLYVLKKIADHLEVSVWVIFLLMERNMMGKKWRGTNATLKELEEYVDIT